MTVQAIHRFWAGREMPEQYQLFARRWQELNPNWSLTDWTEEDIPDLLHGRDDLQRVVDDFYDRDAGRHGVELYVQLADVLGYAIVELLGGMYVNCDMQPVQPLPDEMPDRAWASYENTTDGRIVNAAIGAPEIGDPFWEAVLHRLPERYFANPGAEMVETTGPALLTDTARDLPTEIFVFPVETFNPVHWGQVQPGGDASYWADGTDWTGTGTIAVHHWGHKLTNRSNTIETATR